MSLTLRSIWDKYSVQRKGTLQFGAGGSTQGCSDAVCVVQRPVAVVVGDALRDSIDISAKV